MTNKPVPAKRHDEIVNSLNALLTKEIEAHARTTEDLDVSRKIRQEASDDAKESRALLRDANVQLSDWKHRAEAAERAVKERDITIATFIGKLQMLEQLGTIPPDPAQLMPQAEYARQWQG